MAHHHGHVGGCPGREMGADRRIRRAAEGRRTAPTHVLAASRPRRSFWTAAPHRHRIQIQRTNRGRNCSRWHFGGDIPPSCVRDVPPVLAAGVGTIRWVGRDRRQQEVEGGLERTTLTLPSHHRQAEEVGVDNIPNFLWRVASSASCGGANGATWWRWRRMAVQCRQTAPIPNPR